MINAINGQLVSTCENNIIISTSSGLEYYLECSGNTVLDILSLSDERKKNLRILTYFIHREDAMLLYGFSSEDERKCFKELLSVNGIGAKGALKILSSIRVKDFISLLDMQDVKTLSKIPGIGGKTAQKLILQLKNVLVMDEEIESSDKKTKSFEFSDLVDSCVEMGHERKRVRDRIESLMKENEVKMREMSHEEKERFLFALIIKEK